MDKIEFLSFNTQNVTTGDQITLKLKNRDVRAVEFALTHS